ncbi:serine/threonine-protein kinase [Streptomyces griseosporeus]|uniref:serine/threonine-protein kinase n=1 Tax=Streptomyces griseosporeus TaxID=1910 RepID=UPI0036F5BB49
MRPVDATDPATVGGYPLLARLGAGGMGQVYLSRTPAGRPLAVKVVRPDLAEGADFEARFAREIRNSDLVRSPFTVSVVDFSPPGRRPLWLATEYVPAPSLADWVGRHGPLPEVSVRALAGELAAAITAVHDCSLTHRDVKPSNILLARERPMLIDFGIARAADDSRHTRGNGVIGSPGYLAPEQIAQGLVHQAGDVFALACVLVFAATGHSPFQYPGEDVSAASLLYRVVHEEPRLDGLPPGLLPVVTRCLAKDPDRRPLGRELTELLPRRSDAGWKQTLPAGLVHDLAARQTEVSRLVGAADGTGGPVGVFGPPLPPPAAYPEPLAGLAPGVGGGQGAAPAPARRGRRTAWVVAAAVGVAAVAALVVSLLDPFGGRSGQVGSGPQAIGSGVPSGSATASALPARWLGVWTGSGPGNPRADGRLAPRTDAFEVTLTLHAAAVGELAGKQVSQVSEVGTGREVGCTEALELREVRGGTAVLEAVTSHPTDRSATLLTCEKGHVYVVRLTDDDTLSLGEEGAQSAGAPSELRRRP